MGVAAKSASALRLIVDSVRVAVWNFVLISGTENVAGSQLWPCMSA